MDTGNLIGLVIAYAYVAVIFFIAEIILKNRVSVARKFTHIMIGNIVFLLPIFVGRDVMTFCVAFPVLIFSFLMTKYSPIKVKNSITSSGHGLGLFYYALSWNILAFLFYDKPYIIGVGIMAMSFGDGFASLIGQRFGKHKYSIFGDNKTIEGSLTMFLVSIVMLTITLGYYTFINNAFNMGYPANIMNLFAIVIISLLATITEAISPKGTDNLTVCFVAVISYILLLV